MSVQCINEYIGLRKMTSHFDLENSSSNLGLQVAQNMSKYYPIHMEIIDEILGI